MEARRLRSIPPVKAVMTPFPWYIHLDDSLAHAREVMDLHEIRHLPVTAEGKLVGVVTQRDLALLATHEGRGEQAVRDAFVGDAYVVGLEEPLDRVLLEMARRHIGSALVVRNEKLAGIFTATDACRCFGEHLRTLFPTSDGDEAA